MLTRKFRFSAQHRMGWNEAIHVLEMHRMRVNSDWSIFLFTTGVHESVESFGCAMDPIAMINLRPFRGSDSKLSKAIYAANSLFDDVPFRNCWIIIGNLTMIPSWVIKEGLCEAGKKSRVKVFWWKSSPTQARQEFPMNNQPPRQRAAFRNKVSLRGF